MRHSAGAVVCHSAAQFFFCHFLVSDCLYNVRTGNEHIAGLVDHRDEVGDRGRVHRPTRAWAHNRGDLRNDTGRNGVSEKDVGIPPRGT